MDERQVLFRGDRIARFDLRQDTGRAEHGGGSASEEAADDVKTARSSSPRSQMSSCKIRQGGVREMVGLIRRISSQLAGSHPTERDSQQRHEFSARKSRFK